ncbi:hypothetical protein Efla_006172 [Eimeria flavescens]
MGHLASIFAAFYFCTALPAAWAEGGSASNSTCAESVHPPQHADELQGDGAVHTNTAAVSSSSDHRAASKATTASSMAYTFSLLTALRLLIAAARIAKEGQKIRSLAARDHNAPSDPRASLTYQLGLLQLSAAEESMLTREELWKIEAAKAQFKELLSEAEAWRKKVNKLKELSAKEKDALMIAHAAGAPPAELKSQRRKIERMQDALLDAKLNLSQLLQKLSKAQYDYRQDVLSLNLRAHFYERGRWVSAAASQALAAQERINSPDRHFPLELSKDAIFRVKRLVREHLRTADFIGATVKERGVNKKLAHEAAAVLDDLAYLARELQGAAMFDLMREVVERAEKLQKTVERRAARSEAGLREAMNIF